MGSMHTGLEEAKNGFERMAAFYSERAEGGAGLIVTGGFAPNIQGWLSPFGARMSSQSHAKKHQIITRAVHEADGKICLQILHAGRYGYHPLAVAPSALKSPISPFKPWKLSGGGVEKTIADFVNSAKLAQDAGYDGVEIMGSEGYLINQFIAKRTNLRSDRWGGSFENRIRFPVEIVRRVREKVGLNFIIIYRLSMLDLVDEGSTWEEVVQLARTIETAGATIINTGIGWHEARIPTIATMVPRAGFAWVTKRLMGQVKIPLITTNRINTPEVAEQILAEGCADMVSMARPFLADPAFVKKAAENRSDEINTCIACNQACLDHIFNKKIASCLVNPRACHETELNFHPVISKKKIAVVGAGPAGLAFAVTAAGRGHEIHLFESAGEIGGQFNIAKEIPGKEEFSETLRYFKKQILLTGVQLHLNTRAETGFLLSQNFDHIILAAGVVARKSGIPGEDHPKVLTYTEVILEKKPVGKTVAIVGAGGIGFDTAEFLLHEKNAPAPEIKTFAKEWGVDLNYKNRGALSAPQPEKPARKIYLLQRSAGKPGERLGKTTGWIHRAALKMKNGSTMTEVQYQKIDDRGLHILYKGKTQLLEVDNVVICAGQESNRALFEDLKNAGAQVHLVGGADLAVEIDAKRAIDQATRLASVL